MKKSEPVFYTLKQPPQWLLEHPDHVPWKEGKEKLFRHLVDWYFRYIVDLSDQSEHKLSEDDFLAVRLFTCWIYHWEMAGKDRNGVEIGQSLEQEKGFFRSGKLGGNPLFDLVLASEYAARQNRAAEYFEKKYGGYLRAVAAKINRKLYYSDDEIPSWWNSFCLYLIGLNDTGKVKLNSYMGYSGIKSWLRITLGGYLRDRNRQKNKKKKKEIPFTDLENFSDFGTFSDSIRDNRETVPDEIPDQKDIDEHLIHALKVARSILDPKDWNRIYYFYSKKLHNREIARLYGEEEWNCSRRRDAAFEKFKNRLSAEIKSDPVLVNVSTEILGSLFVENGSDLFHFFNEKPEQNDLFDMDIK